MRLSLQSLTSLIALTVSLVACTSATPGDTSGSSSSSASSAAPVASNVVVTSPVVGATVTSPLTVTGEARGTWYFEASFPVKVLDDQGNQVGIGIAQAEGEWMTTDFVPFTAIVEFTTTASNGFLVLEKDNPSGLPEHAAQVTVPVQFQP